MSSSDPSNLEDADLVERIQEGDTRAHRVIFDRYYARVFSFVNRRLRDPSLSEETTADVFFEVWRNASAFRGESQASTWIFGIAHFKCLEADRHRRRHKRSSVTAVDTDFLNAVPDTHLGVDDHAAVREELLHVSELIEALPEEMRETMQLALLDGLSYGEIASRLGVPEGTVKARVSRARSRLRSGIRLVH